MYPTKYQPIKKATCKRDGKLYSPLHEVVMHSLSACQQISYFWQNQHPNFQSKEASSSSGHLYSNLKIACWRFIGTKKEKGKRLLPNTNNVSLTWTLAHNSTGLKFYHKDSGIIINHITHYISYFTLWRFWHMRF